MTEIIVVFGRGLAGVMERGEKDGRRWVRYADHGPKPRPHQTIGSWVWEDQTRLLTAEEARLAVERERADAAERVANCTAPDCWCQTVLPRPLPATLRRPRSTLRST